MVGDRKHGSEFDRHCVRFDGNIIKYRLGFVTECLEAIKLNKSSALLTT